MKTFFQTILFTLALVLVHVTINDPRALALVAVVGLNTPRMIRFGARQWKGVLSFFEKVATGALVVLLFGILVGGASFLLALPFLYPSGALTVAYGVVLLAVAYTIGTRIVGGNTFGATFLTAFREQRAISVEPQTRPVVRATVKSRAVPAKRVQAAVEKATTTARKAQTANKTGRTLSMEPAAVRMRNMRERRRQEALQGA